MCSSDLFCSAQHLNHKLLFLSPQFPECKFVVRNANYLYTHTLAQKLMMALSYPLALRHGGVVMKAAIDGGVGVGLGPVIRVIGDVGPRLALMGHSIGREGGARPATM